MPHCCINPLPPHAGGHFDADLVADAKVFSAWIGGAWPLTRPPLPDPLLGLTSALHVDLKLWQPDRILGRPYTLNDGMGNSLKAARAARNSVFQDPQKRKVNDYNLIFENLVLPDATRVECAITTFDKWILERIKTIKNAVPAAPPPANGRPYFLSTVGMAQKAINVYLKYMTCWAYAGEYTANPAGFAIPRDPLGIKNFICALHCPIDRLLLVALESTGVGQFLKNENLLKLGYLRQEDGNWRPWSQLNCITTYYGLQWFIRRIAMATWPEGCSSNCFNDFSILINGLIECPKKSPWFVALIKAIVDLDKNDIFKQSADQIYERQSGGRNQSNLTAHSKTQDVKIGEAPGKVRKTKEIIYYSETKNYLALKAVCGAYFNKYGNISYDGILAIKEPTAKHISGSGGPTITPGKGGWIKGANTDRRVRGSGYIAHRAFGSELNALKFLSDYFDFIECERDPDDFDK